MAAVPKLSSLIPAMPSWRQATGHEAMPAAFARMAEAAGAPPAHLMADFAALAFGPGRISFADYERLRLYDAAFWGAADRRAVAGAAQGRRIARIANFRRDCWGLASDRLASSAYLAAHGLPTVADAGDLPRRPGRAGRQLLRTRDELRQFLREPRRRPADRPAVRGRTGPPPVRRRGRSRAAEIDRFIDAVERRRAGQLALPGAARAAPRRSPTPAASRRCASSPSPPATPPWSPAPPGCSADRTSVVASLDVRSGAARAPLAGAGAAARRDRARRPRACPTGRR